jgi:CRISPR type III-B/RAMP module RAMP protein Cmr1
MSSWLEVQKTLVKDELIAEIDVETISLTRLGGYNARPYSWDLKLLTKPTAKSLKGVWRWWARTAIVGAYNGKITYKEANEHLNKLFGSEKGGISEFTLDVSDVRLPKNYEEKLEKLKKQVLSKEEQRQLERKLKEIPRIKLLLLSRKSQVSYEEVMLIPEGVKFRITIYGSKNFEKVNFALSSFLLALVFGGIGSITRRAFGSLKISSFRFGDNLNVDPELKKIVQDIQSKDFTENELRDTLKKLCEIAIKHALKLYEISAVQQLQNQKTMPLVPSLSNIKIEVKKCSSVKLDEVGKVFLKQTWKGQKANIRSSEFHTWILGLPRCQQKQGTGYFITTKLDPGRRISSIGVRYFRTKTKLFVVVFGLLSMDWPKDLLHISKNKKEEMTPIPVNERKLQDAFDSAFETILKILTKEGVVSK